MALFSVWEEAVLLDGKGLPVRHLHVTVFTLSYSQYAPNLEKIVIVTIPLFVGWMCVWGGACPLIGRDICQTPTGNSVHSVILSVPVGLRIKCEEDWSL